MVGEEARQAVGFAARPVTMCRQEMKRNYACMEKTVQALELRLNPLPVRGSTQERRRYLSISSPTVTRWPISSVNPRASMSEMPLLMQIL